MIDLASIKIHNRSLRVSQRARNVAHLLNKEKDKKLFIDFGLHDLIHLYFDMSKLSDRYYQKFMRVLVRSCKRSYLREALQVK